MPTFEITSPDGRKFRIEAPEGATKADALAKIQAAHSAGDEFPAEKPSAAVKMGRGMMDLYQGVKQLGLMAKDSFTGGNEANAYTKQVGEEIANYEKGRKAGGDTGFDWMRLAGNVATPAVMLPGGVGANLAARIGTGAAAGAAQSGLMFTPEGESKLGQTAVGAVGGAVVPAAIDGVTRGLRAMANKGGNVAADIARSGIDESALAGQLQTIVQNSGVDWNTLTGQARSALAAEARNQMQVGGNLNAEALGRIARAQALDPRLALTRGQATRSPMDWQTEQNLRSIQGVGDELRTRFGGQGQVLGEVADRLRGGAPTNRPFQAGEQAIGAVRQKFAETGDDVSSLYRLARETVGIQADVPLAPLQGRAIQALNEFDDVIPSPIKSRLQALGINRMGPVNPTKAFTVEEAEALDKLINKRWDASNKPLTAALSELKGAIRESLSAIGDQGGNEAAQAFRAAKGAASSRFDEFGQKIARAATDDVAPDQFVRKFVTGGDVRDIRNLVKTLTTGTGDQLVRGGEALNSVRAATLTELFERTGALADGMLSGAKLDTAMKNMGTERINAIFTPDQVKSLEMLRQVSLDLTKPPPLADINYSRTTSTLANLLGTIGKIPGLGMAAKVGQAEADRVQKAAVQSAMKGGAAVPRVPLELITREQQNALARRLAPATVGANALIYQANQ